MVEFTNGLGHLKFKTLKNLDGKRDVVMMKIKSGTVRGDLMTVSKHCPLNGTKVW